MLKLKKTNQMKKDFSTIEKALMWLIAQGDSILDSNIFPKQIAAFLCGENYQIAIDFMNGKENTIEDFLNNVSHNSDVSNSYILRAIQLHLINKEQ